MNVVVNLFCIANMERVYDLVPEDLPEQIRLVKDPDPFISLAGSNYKKAKKDWMDFFEKRYLSTLLKRHNGNISKAALEARVNRKTIHRLLKRCGLTQDPPG